ncbi:MAG: YdcF family protein [Candidatus Acidiferrales bacterium]
MRALFVIAALLLVVVAGIAGFHGAGRWLVREDAIAKGDVIVVLSGGLPYRAEQAAALYKQGYAPEMWVSWPESPVAEMEALGVKYVGEEEYDRQILISEGVPASAIRIFPETILDTQQEIEEIAREMRRSGKTRVIIVTSPQHTRRVKTLWKSLAGGGLEAIVRAAFQDPFDADHWWRNSRDALAVVREYLGLLNAWAGLPVRPHAQ